MTKQIFCFFFFSSRRRHTRSLRDWSSDVCSSDLDGDQIYAVIRGCALNNDGSSKVGFTAPSIEGQSRVVAMAHEAAGVSPDTIGYIEAHGTGTPLGDPIELAALTQAFRAKTTAKQFCAIGTAK